MDIGYYECAGFKREKIYFDDCKHTFCMFII